MKKKHIYMYIYRCVMIMKYNVSKCTRIIHYDVQTRAQARDVFSLLAIIVMILSVFALDFFLSLYICFPFDFLLDFLLFFIIQTALHWAAKHGNEDVVKLIAGTHKADVNAKTVTI